jgi:hypothetical protein
MIKNIVLEQATSEESPTKTQLKRLVIGDKVLLGTENGLFWATILLVQDDDIVGRVWGKIAFLEDVKENELITFEKKNVLRVIPDENRHKLPPYMLLTHNDHQEHFVLHTAYPKLIAKIAVGDKVEAKEAVWIDERPYSNNETPRVLEKITDWYFYNYVKKSNGDRQEITR